MSFFRCNGCDNMCTVDADEISDASKLFCAVTGESNPGFREVDPADEDPCFCCSDHCPAHDCARKQEFEERIRNGYVLGDDEEWE